MKKVLIFVLGILSIPCFGQEVMEDESYVSDNIVRQEYGLPIIREVYGGTKIIVDFNGNWTNEMKGAFEYACKIWEEAMPTTFPIRILAKLDEETQSASLSRIAIQTRSHTNDKLSYHPYTNVSTWTQIKGTAYIDFSGRGNAGIYDNILSEDMFKEHDITITYFNKSNKLIENCSFALDENTIDDNYYDFVTIVLRDIAKSFGIIWNNKIVRNEQFRINTNNILPYEKHVLDCLGYDGDNHQAYLNAIKGSLAFGKFTIYAPVTWDQERSLNYFIPDENVKLSQLLSFDFGRGSVIRDISDVHTYNFFENTLNWKSDITVGDNLNSFNQKGTTTDNVVPFNGTIFEESPQKINISSIENTEKSADIKKNSIEKTNNILTSFLKIYSHDYYGGEFDFDGWAICLLKKDGTWDNVYFFGMPNRPLEVSTTDFTLNYDIEEYARTCDGYLRCRITYSQHLPPTYKRTSGWSKYYVLDYLPQRVKMSKSKVLPPEDEYYRDVEIGLKDIEGVTRVVVSQLDEGNDMPYQYEVPDFRKGYFTATVDREFTSTFTITAYNKNGSTKSETYVLQPLTPTTSIDLKFNVNNDQIKVFLDDTQRHDTSGRLLVSSYQIKKVMPYTSEKTIQGLISLPKRPESNIIDISTLDNGIYILTVYDIKGGCHTLKFTKNNIRFL